MKMPAWWKGKSKSKPKPSSSRRSAAEQEQSHPVDDEDVMPNRGSGRGKVKGNIFDGILVFRRSKVPSPISAGGGCGGGGGNVSVFGQPLPLPKSISSPLPSLVSHEHPAVAGSASASASVSVSVSTSSGSSSESSDETPDLGFYRYFLLASLPIESFGDGYHHVYSIRTKFQFMMRRRESGSRVLGPDAKYDL